MEHKWLRLFKDGEWTGETRTIRVNGELHDLDEYANSKGITLPDRVNTNEDMEQAQPAGDSEQSVGGDSQSTE